MGAWAGACLELLGRGCAWRPQVRLLSAVKAGRCHQGCDSTGCASVTLARVFSHFQRLLLKLLKSLASRAGNYRTPQTFPISQVLFTTSHPAPATIFICSIFLNFFSKILHSYLKSMRYVKDKNCVIWCALQWHISLS